MKRRRLIINGFVAMAGIAIPAFGQAKKSTPKPRPEKARDPVCGLMVEKDPQLSAVYKGKTYYFCSKADRDKFKKNPEKYVKGK
jgi:YHS domain-containing protein